MKIACLPAALFGILLLSGCVEPYLPKEITSANTYLVVDALLELGEDSLTIRLGRTQRVNSQAGIVPSPPPEPGANVSLEGDQSTRLAFVETSKGTYRMRTPALKETELYRLVIKTSSGQQYHSAYVPVKKSPPIDELTYRINPGRDGVKVYVSTHDAQNQTWFYRWKFEETFEYQTDSLHYATLEVVRDPITGMPSIVPRPKAKDDSIKICWRTVKPTTLMLGTSVGLTQDVIRDLPILEVPASSNKLLYDYSLLVKQYALSREAYDFFSSLAKTTETTGSLFDPMPSQVTGNVHNVADAKEPVFGFFCILTSVQKRIRIREGMGNQPFCELLDCLSECNPRDPRHPTTEDYTRAVQEYQTYDQVILSSDAIIDICIMAVPHVRCSILTTFYRTVDPSCRDCRLQGGKTTKPDFMK